MTSVHERFPFPDEEFGRVPRSCAHRRKHDPLGSVTLPSGDVVRLAVRHDDVAAVLADPRFSRDLSKPGCPRLQSGADMSDDHDTLINMDPPRHSRVRGILSRAFTPRAIESWRPRIRQLADELVAGMRVAGPPGDLVAAVAEPLPIRVIAEILGVAGGDLDQFREWSSLAMSIGDDLADARAKGKDEFFAYLRELIAEHRREPHDDLLDAMIGASVDNDRLTEDELCDTVRSLLLAGYETTMTTIGRGMFTLLRHPGQYRALVAEPELLPGAVEEILRYDFPADVGFLRFALEDVPLPSGVIRAGEGVMPLISSANHDATRFHDPETFDIHRPDTGNMSFGRGPHYCVGGPLARVQIQEALGAVVRGLPDLALALPAGQVPWNPSMVTHSISELSVTWSHGGDPR
ncbi:cytochrome P450 [Kutzneria sp. CA-103260]|uniref:cytochrome P450 n=1 Tax=Kutzneria sp. CA-103260 TaxID=2802641 RepID=UPI001BA58ED2|nr:cytochrome P450 [Kutzneria sp. CA-103260]QUQ64344.1 cytochrome P450 [Kutzneria sp. CA-103260]